MDFNTIDVFDCVVDPLCGANIFINKNHRSNHRSRGTEKLRASYSFFCENQKGKKGLEL